MALRVNVAKVIAPAEQCTEVLTAAKVQDKVSAVKQSSTDVSTRLWYLYMVRCAKGQLYTGITTDVARRFSEHQSGSAKSAKFLRGKGPLTLVYSETVGSHSDALKREIALKKWSRAQKLALIAAFE
ncbi:GIY-YIG nuclease family protein [Shewanella sairae]|uniref:GIY-YIG nuclease family protein n=1 Tax=Shewanella sairae TaxID=190310 RepID=UPI001FEB5A7E|nr:GIY-YIG nuclease family protein [Shewanella sairae]MCL1131050.1 GIY-YIG nuclease family protein [Shewanella sairae]